MNVCLFVVKGGVSFVEVDLGFVVMDGVRVVVRLFDVWFGIVFVVVCDFGLS